MIDSNLYIKLCSYENLLQAFQNARKGKTTKEYVVAFEQNLDKNLQQLQSELLFHFYKPKPLETFILRDPKTRKISKSDFRDRIVHHALYLVIGELFEKTFIFDSYANRKTKGTLKAILQFGKYEKKISQNFTLPAYVLKADIRQYFDTVSHQHLLSVIQKKISDPRVLWLIKTILANYKTKEEGIGMPLGNLTSQFFANVYLNELDQFVKHQLRARYYIRYVDDFVIFHRSKRQLEAYKIIIGIFLREKLALRLHPDKSKVIPLQRGVEFLGMKIFPYHKLIKKKNLKKFYRKYTLLCEDYDEKVATYDEIYDFLEGWLAYAKNANTHKLRKKVLQQVEQKFPHEISTKEVNRARKRRKQKNKPSLYFLHPGAEGKVLPARP